MILKPGLIADWLPRAALPVPNPLPPGFNPATAGPAGNAKLLPSFQGKDAQKQAIEYGVKITGCSTHFIDEGTDTGPIILQEAVHIKTNDTVHTLAEKILKEEHKLLVKSVKLLCDDRIEVRGRHVIIH